MKKMTLLFLVLVSCNATQAMLYEPLTPAEILRMDEFYKDNPGTVALIFCCSAITVCGMELLRPRYQDVRAKAAHYLTSCSKRINPIREEFVAAHENGMVKTLFGTAAKTVKME